MAALGAGRIARPRSAQPPRRDTLREAAGRRLLCAMAETILHDLAAFTRGLQQPRVLLFKHSPVCPISAEAREHYEAFRRELSDVPTLFVAGAIVDHPAKGPIRTMEVRLAAQ
jgi:hypothetical protein